MIDTIKSRRTIRKYQQKDITPDLLDNLLETSFRAPTMGGMQFYSIVITRNAEKKEILPPAHLNQPVVRSASVALTFYADFRRFRKHYQERNAKLGYDNLMPFLNAAMDTLLVAQTSCTFTGEAGLGVCCLGTTTYDPRMVIDALHLLELTLSITTITVGYPVESPKQVDRPPIEGIIHEESYCDYTAEDISRLYTYKESLSENKQFIEENYKETLAQVFTDVHYTKEDNGSISESLLKVLRQQGSMNNGQ